MYEKDELITTFEIELKRGTLTLAVLSQLKTPQYGYSLLQELVDKNVEIEAGTLYPLLRRLEKQEILESSWDTSESRPRKYYVLSSKGFEVLEKLESIWNGMSLNINKLIGRE